MFLPLINCVILGNVFHVSEMSPLYRKNGIAPVPIPGDSRGLNELIYVSGIWQELYKDIRAIINIIVIIIIECPLAGSKCLNCEAALGLFRKEDWKEGS